MKCSRGPVSVVLVVLLVAVGVRCRECARQNLDSIMLGSPRQYLLAALSAVATALLLGWMPGALLWLGIIYGYVGLIEGLIERFHREMGPARVVATGGLAEVIAGETSLVEIVDPMLTLEGLRLIYEMNAVVATRATG